MGKKIVFVLVTAILVASTLACSVTSIFAGSTPVPVATAVPTNTQVPPEMPTLQPPATETPVPSPTVDPCNDPANVVFGFMDNEASKGFGTIDEDIQKHFPGNGVIVIEGLQKDADSIHAILSSVSGLTAPPFFKTYQELEVKFLTDYATGLDYAIAGDKQKAFTFLIQSDADYKLLKAEIDHLRSICPANNTQEATS